MPTLGKVMKINNWYKLYISSSWAHKSHLLSLVFVVIYPSSMEHANRNTLVNIPHRSIGNQSIGTPIVKASISNVPAFRLINLKLIKYLYLTKRCFLSRITALVLQQIYRQSPTQVGIPMNLFVYQRKKPFKILIQLKKRHFN